MDIVSKLVTKNYALQIMVNDQPLLTQTIRHIASMLSHPSDVMFIHLHIHLRRYLKKCTMSAHRIFPPDSSISVL